MTAPGSSRVNIESKVTRVREILDPTRSKKVREGREEEWGTDGELGPSRVHRLGRPWGREELGSTRPRVWG